MGLMLSVLVFCVGVAEILDCWHHFLLHLVQPQYNPLPSHLDLKSDYLNDQELLNPVCESRRTSNVDICWPKDLSPDDNLHIIKKRSYVEVARTGEHDLDLSHRVVKKLLHQEKDTIPSLTPTSENAEGICPYIVVHSPDATDYNVSPVTSRETSPNKLELGVIVESDSSSEVDEPSQIENVNYRRVKESMSLDQEDELKDLCSDVNTSDGPRPKCPSSQRFEEECNNESIRQISSIETFDSETTSFPELPVFTDNILSDDVKRVHVHYPKTLGVTSPGGDTLDNTDKKTELCKDLKCNSSRQNTESDNNTSVLPISTILDEGLEPISEFPEINIHESSPIPQSDDSDSSVNTSDASWMVRSKTSDRPLIIRFDTSPEKVQQDFQSVVQTDLRSFGNKDQHDSSLRPLEKVDSVDEYYDALVSQNGAKERQEVFQSNMRTEANLNVSDNLDSEEFYNEANVKPLSVNLMQPESNSSSSSLSGIPQLPEDTFESLSQTSLATDNCYSNNSDVAPTNSNEETSAMSFSTGNTSNINEIKHCFTKQSLNLPREALSGGSIQIADSEDIEPGKYCQGTVEGQNPALLDNVNKKKEGLVSKSYLEEQNVLEDNKNRKDSSGSITSHPTVNTSQVSASGLKPVNKSSSINNNSDTNSKLSLCQEKTIMQDESQISSDRGEEIKNEEKCPEILQKQTPSDRLTKESVAKSLKEESTTNIPLESNLTSSDLNTLETLSTDKKDNPNIPTLPQESTKPKVHEKETSKISKEKSSTIQKSKPSSKHASTDSDTVVLCRAKTSDEDIHVENQADSASVKSNLPNDPILSETEQRVETGPSRTSEEPKPSTSKSEEDKSFWLIFSGEYTKAMNKDWHSGHFCCWQCDESLTGQRYVLRDEHPYCVKCYESVFANGCEECSKTIGIDSKDLSYKDKHWHEACFLCNKCRVSLVDKQFGSKLDKIFCGNCYDQQFASRCDGCGQIFKAGTKKMEYKTRQWHEPCFSCCVCKSPIGTKSFIPREQEIYCATCYEEKFATRCVKCNKIITSGGVTYKNEPWHRECFTCTNCNTSLAGQRFTSRDEKPYCADCFGELFAKRCTACSKPITGIGGTRFISFEDRHWHNDCFICASCKTSLVGRGFITDGDDIICPECAKQKLM